MRKYVYPNSRLSSPGTSDDESSSESDEHLNSITTIRYRDLASRARSLQLAIPQPAHQRLKPGQIRLLRIRHTWRSAKWKIHNPISCSISTFWLNNAPEFKALSYTWAPPYLQHVVVDGIDGSQEPVEHLSDCKTRILVNGKSTRVHTNLHSALGHLRLHLRRGIYLWVDALCILQSDLQERSAQVQQMARIYSTASTVYVWLGPNPGLKHNVLAFIREFCNVASRLLDQDTRAIKAQYRDTAILDPSSFSILDIENFEEKLVDLMVFLKVCRYPARLWCLQEVVLARRTMILGWNLHENFSCITYLVDYFSQAGWFPWLDEMLETKQRYWDGKPWEALEGMRSTLFRRYHGRPSHLCKLHSRAELDAISPIAAAFFDFAVLLCNSRNMICSDPNDKIYALLGVAETMHKDLVSPLPTVDYSHHFSTLYMNVQQKILQVTQSPDLLSYIGQSLHHYDSTLPSWVPDWRVGGPLFSCFEAALRVNDGSVPPILLRSEQSYITFEGTAMHCWGYELDEIEHNYVLADEHDLLDAAKAMPRRHALTRVLFHAHEQAELPATLSTVVDTVFLGATPTAYQEMASDSHDARLDLGTYVTIGHVYDGLPGDRSAPSRLERCDQVLEKLAQWTDGDNRLSEELEHLVADCKEAVKGAGSGDPDEAFKDLEPKCQPRINRFVASVKKVADLRSLIRTKRGWLASAQNRVRAGDKIFVLAGSRTPFVLRKKPGVDDAYILDGDCYLWDGQTGVKDAMATLRGNVRSVKIV
jgi:hypothetical protein